MAKRRKIVTVCETALLLAAAVAVVVALRNHRQPAPPPDAPVAQTPAAVRVKAVERKAELVERGEIATASDAVAIVCGMDEATADRYEARNDALKNYVMNLLRNQDPPVEGLAETLIAMIEGRPVAGFGRSGRAGVPSPAADSYIANVYDFGKSVRNLAEKRGLLENEDFENPYWEESFWDKFSEEGRARNKEINQRYETRDKAIRDIVVPELEKCLKKEGECAK